MRKLSEPMMRPLAREQLLEQCDPRFMAALTFGNNGPLPARNRTLGPTWVRFVHEHCVMGEGDVYGRPARMTPEQQALFWKLAELNDDGSRRFEFALITLAKGSGKSPVLAWLGCIELASDCAVFREWAPNGNPRGMARGNPGVLNMASSYEQADLVLDEMRASFEHEEAPMKGRAAAGKGEIVMHDRKAIAKRIPATPRRADGSKSPLLLVDEVHELTTENQEKAVDVAWGGTSKRENGLTIFGSTAGNDMTSLFGRQVARGKRGDFAENELFVCMEAETGLDPTNDADIITGIRQANPLAARGVANVRKLLGKFKGMPLNRAKRYYWNQWVPSDESWLPAGAWDANSAQRRGLTIEFEPSWPTWLGADMALKRDSAAVVTLQQRPAPNNRSKLGTLYQATSKIWLPDGELIDQDGPNGPDAYIRLIASTYALVWAAADEAWWPTLPQLEKGDEEHPPVPMFRMPQQGRNMIVAYARLYKLIVQGELIHDGAPDFADQIASAATQSSDRGWTLRKGKNRRRIDSAPALAAAVFASGLEPPVTEPVKPRSKVF
ncbi:terminase large subunit domain-containing protein [Brevundimonas sp.]|uniref:terminase large subunit domain-containing protein n=1 Tax=Brevundimonas sp. TaxID=1871086 RepID=UPI002D779E6C|nr:terminase large subunit [Brevundimonas sp.]